MPFGEAMLSTLKSNKRIRLDKSKRFRKTLGGYGPKLKVQYNFPKASSDQLKAIRDRLQAERRTSVLRHLLIVFLIVVGLGLVIFTL